MTSFKSYAWAEYSFWYQYDSSNPTINGIPTNYRNYFLCKGAGITVKPILMAITLQLKLRNCYKVFIQSLSDWTNWENLGTGQYLWGLLDVCRNSDAESLTLFTWNPVPSDYNYLYSGNLENGDPSIDWNGDETGFYKDPAMKGARFSFEYCDVLKNGDMPKGSINPYELHNGGPNGDLYCWADPNTSWQPK